MIHGAGAVSRRQNFRTVPTVRGTIEIAGRSHGSKGRTHAGGAQGGRMVLPGRSGRAGRSRHRELAAGRAHVRPALFLPDARGAAGRRRGIASAPRTSPRAGWTRHGMKRFPKTGPRRTPLPEGCEQRDRRDSPQEGIVSGKSPLIRAQTVYTSLVQRDAMAGPPPTQSDAPPTVRFSRSSS